MARLFIFFFISFFFKLSYGQLRPFPGRPRQLTEKEVALEKRNQECLLRNKLTGQQRLLLYPFNKAAQVQLVSFGKPDSLFIGELPLKNRTVDYLQLKEVVTLNRIQTDSLSDILYNYGYRGVFHVELKMLCYNPRNAILFVDARGQQFAFIELCFECQGYRTSSKMVKAGDFCTQKYDLLKAFFASHGITYGTKEEADVDEQD